MATTPKAPKALIIAVGIDPAVLAFVVDTDSSEVWSAPVNVFPARGSMGNEEWAEVKADVRADSARRLSNMTAALRREVAKGRAVTVYVAAVLRGDGKLTFDKVAAPDTWDQLIPLLRAAGIAVETI